MHIRNINLQLVLPKCLLSCLCLNSSEISWESSKPAKKKRFKPLAFETSKAIELAYQNYLNQKAIQAHVQANIVLDAGVEVCNLISVSLRGLNP